MNKFFFMASLTANLNGRPVVGFNTIVALDRRNVLAAGLTRIQNAGATMLAAEGMTHGQDFNDIVIQNIFFLAECTEEEFTEGTQLNAAPVDEQQAIESADNDE